MHTPMKLRAFVPRPEPTIKTETFHFLRIPIYGTPRLAYLLPLAENGTKKAYKHHPARKFHTKSGRFVSHFITTGTRYTTRHFLIFSTPRKLPKDPAFVEIIRLPSPCLPFCTVKMSWLLPSVSCLLWETGAKVAPLGTRAPYWEICVQVVFWPWKTSGLGLPVYFYGPKPCQTHKTRSMGCENELLVTVWSTISSIW